MMSEYEEGRPKPGSNWELPKASASPADAAQSLTLKDLSRVERLLVQLEAKSLALVPYSQTSPAARLNKAVLAGTLTSLWLSTLVAAVTFACFVKHAPQVVGRVPAPIAPAILTAPALYEKAAASPVNGSVNALKAFSSLVTQQKRATEHRNWNVQHTTAKINSVSAMSRVSEVNAGEVRSMPPPAFATGSRSRFWDPLLDVKPTEVATAHRRADGNIDYWVLPHGPFFSEPAKVLPIGRCPNGVYVRNLEDGHNYRLTPSGEWYILRVPLEK